MKRLLNILIISTIYLAFCGKSCVDEGERMAWQENQAELAKDSIRDEFEADYLTEEARYATEVKAIQELNDLADYLEVYSDKSLDSTFREKAGDMIKRTFISEESMLSFGPLKNKKMKTVTLGKFLEKGFGQDILQSKVIFDSIWVLEPLQKADAEIYSGKLAAYQTVIFIGQADSIISPSLPITIEFISSKREKIIGQDTLKVWEVSLGDFE